MIILLLMALVVVLPVLFLEGITVGGQQYPLQTCLLHPLQRPQSHLCPDADVQHTGGMIPKTMRFQKDGRDTVGITGSCQTHTA